ncbi:hypothetical protein [Tsukamurella sp. PLM1]|uniref:hypothetical protein n=1 Tax=Tsukamurella sp. PLM1 TaxID=2929795 RepID=UPI00206C9D3B|nr:hypothetical protein [Tsukamurella sp. PLM1]BDH55994.1 hypothetical protein MTP03_09330 [Tsukamurella sp. PLM1]
MLDRVTLTAIAARVLLPGQQRVSERTLRRRYGSTTRLLFGAPWWMPEPADAVRAVLAPRVDPGRGPVWPCGREAEDAAAVVDDCFCLDGRPERDDRNRILHASCCEGERADDAWPPAEFFIDAGVEDPLGDPVRTSPEPIPLRDMLCDLHVVITGHLIGTGWASRLPQIAALLRERPEVAAWVTLSERAWAERLAPHRPSSSASSGPRERSPRTPSPRRSENWNPSWGSWATPSTARLGAPAAPTPSPAPRRS